MTYSEVIVPAVFVLVPVLAGAAVGLSIKSSVGWYQSIPKPSWAPPKELFGPVWTLLYAAMGLAAWLAWRAGAPSEIMTLFVVQLLLNLAWSPVFFVWKDPEMALAVILVLLGAIAYLAVEFYHVSKLAGALLLPYVAWVAYASALNAAIVKAL